MTEGEARKATIDLFGEDSFTECERDEKLTRYYVGPLPTVPGPYMGYMGFSWKQALELAREANG